ncbi:hypothetical protein D9758_006385 [Tetrapyrgos nigripes]|uniref:BZIP domain-containing protein n=1 Tax=Tetrapyrgos nigripes TaxID=182062 RepID=A0A8H5D988_9AGAR|nr:hypothetical protein D9758_006385 [Tetrapyrgos nigripes]
MPSNLRGLNIVHPVQPDLDSQDLLSGQPFPDLSAQLALWTNLPFESEEGPSTVQKQDNFDKGMTDERVNEEIHRQGLKAMAAHDGHINVVTGINIEQPQVQPRAQHQMSGPQQQLDLHSILSTLGIDPFTAAQQLLQSQQPPVAPSLAQLLTLHSASAASSFQQHLPQASAPNLSGSSSSQIETTPPPAKRARTRKASVSTADSPEADTTSANPLSASEDKRRRNTAASARFRLKKKEREMALESKAKELETRVNELEKECEGLRRENGWLKGLVVGVTGAAQSNAQSSALPSLKRSREEEI